MNAGRIQEPNPLAGELTESKPRIRKTNFLRKILKQKVRFFNSVRIILE